MQNSRLFEIVYLLMDQKKVTAQYLADHFEVSVRTIYRDVDALSLAGIPIYALVGKGGGICLMDHFVLNKSILSEDEQRGILMGLQSLSALDVGGTKSVLEKMSRFFQKEQTPWIDVSFSNWGNQKEAQAKFETLKTAILGRNLVSCHYYSGIGQKTKRQIEPFQLLFKGQSWYVYGFCRLRSDFRVFKLSRITDLRIEQQSFQRVFKPFNLETPVSERHSLVELVLRFKPEMAFRVLDEFDSESIIQDGEGNFIVSLQVPDVDWVLGFVLSFGDSVEVLSPDGIKKGLIQLIKRTNAFYEKK